MDKVKTKNAVISLNLKPTEADKPSSNTDDRVEEETLPTAEKTASESIPESRCL